MKVRGGYLPRIAGRPASAMRAVALPERLFVDLGQGGILYRPVAAAGARVRFGDPLAEAEIAGGTIQLPAPATGTVAIEAGANGAAARMILTVTSPEAGTPYAVLKPERATSQDLRQALARGGLWPAFWSSATGGVPSLDGGEQPRRIVVNCVNAEPFRVRGKLVLRERLEQVVSGMAFLQRLLADYGTLELLLTSRNDPVAVAVQQRVAGQAWVHVEAVPLRYPVEIPQVICRALRRPPPAGEPPELLWVVEVQDVAAMGACLGEGRPAFERVLAVGGPGASAPTHVRARIGTRFDAILPPADLAGNRRVLKGGLFRGTLADGAAAVGWSDDAIFVLPRPETREFLSFVRLGCDRCSRLPVFASALTGATDRRLTTSLRGEERPCIGCGLCEEVCPAGLLPQVLHQTIYREEFEEAGTLGLHRCVRCGLCAYVCPSKLELLHEFTAAQERLQRERAEVAAAEAARRNREQAREAEQQRKDDWRT